ncbi:MAG: superoxide dismutase [Ni] [Planctomycetota bacterium]
MFSRSQLLGLVVLLPFYMPIHEPSVASAPPTAPAKEVRRHCQIPCGIYGDRMRIDMMMEDALTIQVGQGRIVEMAAQKTANYNQIVRWIVNKDKHAQSIQELVANYWLAQRIKTPKDGSDPKATAAYLNQLRLMHGITVSAMKCKQTNDLAHVKKLKDLVLEFSKTYFKKEDLEHIQRHHGGH